MRKRQAQAACPEMVLAGADADRDGQQYEPIVAAVMEVVPVVEVLRPGLLVIPLTMSLCRHLGDEQVIAERLTDVVGSCGAEALAGIAYAQIVRRGCPMVLGVALMGVSRGQYTFLAHLRWTWAIALGYALSILTHLWWNAAFFTHGIGAAGH